MNHRTRLGLVIAGALSLCAATVFGASSTFRASAGLGPGESTVVAVTPTRILDTRTDLGLPGPFVSAVPQKLTVVGPIPTADGTTATVVPPGATGVLLNVTVVAAQAAGFVSIRPGDATGPARTSSLNFEAGAIVPNSVQVALPTGGATAGQIDITYDAFGQSGPSTDVLIDVVGYITSAGINDLAAQLAAKANAADVYTKTQSDSRYAGKTETKVVTALDAVAFGGASPSGTCVQFPASTSTIFLDLGLPSGARIDRVVIRGTDTAPSASLVVWLSGDVNTVSDLLGGQFESVAATAFESNMTMLPNATNAPGGTAWYLYGFVSGGLDGALEFCGAIVTYTLP
jgi:hypothetical protein